MIETEEIIGSEKIIRLNDYKFQVGQIKRNGNSFYLNLCAYVHHNDNTNLSTHLSRLIERLSHLMNSSVPQLFDSFSHNIITYNCTNRLELSKDNWTFVNIELTTFTRQPIFFKDSKKYKGTSDMDKIELLGYVMLDFLEEVNWLSFRSRK